MASNENVSTIARTVQIRITCKYLIFIKKNLIIHTAVHVWNIVEGPRQDSSIRRSPHVRDIADRFILLAQRHLKETSESHREEISPLRHFGIEVLT